MTTKRKAEVVGVPFTPYQEGGLKALEIVKGVIDEHVRKLERLQVDAGDAYGVFNGLVNLLWSIRSQAEAAVCKELIRGVTP